MALHGPSPQEGNSATLYSEPPFNCLHVTSLLSDVSADQLATIFGTQIEYVLLDPQKKQAWIKYPNNPGAAKNAIERYKKKSDHHELQYIFVQEPIQDRELCKDFIENKCTRGRKCNHKHVYRATEKENYYYRIRIIGLPSTVKKDAIESKFGRPKHGYYSIPDEHGLADAHENRHAYLMRQPSEAEARIFVKKWDGKYFDSNRLKCQIETDRESFAVHNGSADYYPYDVVLSQLSQTETPNKMFEDKYMTSNPTQAKQDTNVSIMPQNHANLSNPSVSFEIEGFPVFLPNGWELVLDGPDEFKNILSGQGDIRLIRWRDEYAVIKVYKVFDKEQKKLRPYREYIALKTIRGLENVAYFIETNIPDDQYDAIERQKKDQLKKNGKLWIIMKLVKGCTLEKYLETEIKSQSVISVCDAVGFSVRLLEIIKRFHERGVVHRDLKPDNIQVEFTSENRSLFETNITILDFGQAFIQVDNQQVDSADFDQEEMPKFQSALNTTLGNEFYRVPQLRPPKKAKNFYEEERLVQLRRSPTIDASSVCAILFWLITYIVPNEEYIKQNDSIPPHYTAESKKAISNAILQALDTPGDSFQCDKRQLELYLMHTFDRGFADAFSQWTVDQLLCHLALMYQLLTGSLTLSDGKSILQLPIQAKPLPFANYFSEAAIIFTQAKEYFVHTYIKLHWEPNTFFRWIDEIDVSPNQRKSVDRLTFYDCGQKWSTEIRCLAVFVDHIGIKLLIESTVGGINVQLPVYSLLLKADIRIINQNEVNVAFAKELRRLLEVFLHKSIG